MAPLRQLGMQIVITGLVLGGGMLAGAQAPALLAVQTFAGVSYVSGGVGEDEHAALRAVEREYNLKLTFALAGGHYLGEAAVVITAAPGRVILDAVSQGPWFLARLPAGTYTIHVARGGVSRQQVMHVREDWMMHVPLTWSGAS